MPLGDTSTERGRDDEQNHETNFHVSHGGRGVGGSRPVEEAEAVAGDPGLNHETDFHVSPVGGVGRPHYRGRDTVRIAGEEWSVETVVEVERLRRMYRSEYRTLMVALGEPTRRGILAALLKASPRTYRELDEWTGTTTRTVKTHVSDLSDAGILEVGSGKPAAISFSNDDLRLLSSDVLSFL